MSSDKYTFNLHNLQSVNVSDLQFDILYLFFGLAKRPTSAGAGAAFQRRQVAGTSGC